MKILFLDVDGVLNRCGKSGHGLEEDKLLLLKSIVDATGCHIVLSSTWRKTEHQRARINDAFYPRGMRIFSSTPVLDKKVDGLWHSVPRGEEIRSWINYECATIHPPKFVILDDEADMGDLLPHLVKTDSFTGLTPEIAQEVINRLK